MRTSKWKITLSRPSAVRFGTLLALASLLAACDNGGSSDNAGNPLGDRAYCMSIGGTVSTTDDPTCGGCRIESPANAADGTLGAWATISLNQFASGPGPAIRATATEHTPGGAAGAWVHIPQGAQGWTVTVRTYLGGTAQESTTMPSTTPAGTPAFDTYLSVDTTLAYDAIEVQMSDANFTAVDVSFRVYELCSDGGVQGQ